MCDLAIISASSPSSSGNIPFSAIDDILKELNILETKSKLISYFINISFFVNYTWIVNYAG